MRVYFSHPWEKREELKVLITKIEALGIEIVNPFSHTEYAERLTKEFGKMLKTPSDISDEEWEKIARKVVHKDLRYIRKSDAIVAVFDGEVRFSAGTPMEVFFASHDLEIPAYVMMYNADKIPRMPYHCWIRRFSDKIFFDEAELLKELEKAAKEESK